MNETITWRERVEAAAQDFVPGTRAQRLLLLLLLLLALVLRCWDLPHIPYTHDELSALVRVDYPTLADAINKGVVQIDTHPPGVHAFLWAWTHLFGTGEGVVKFPFIIASVLAIALLYRFAFAWAGGNVALMIAALMSTLQYSVMYGQIARPYAIGLFTTALLADQLTRFIGTGSRRSLIIATIAALLCAYTHHFALMLAALMCLSALVWIDRAERKRYAIALGIAVLCYVPNVPLTLAQFGWKGLDEWLAPPGPDWIPDYLWWTAHCSMLLALLLASLVLLAALLRIRHRGTIAPVWWISLVWGLLPLVIGYAYSLWRAPVLQYSVVLFSFPYLLLGMFAGLRFLKSTHAVVLASIATVVSVFTLITSRQHYQVFYRSKYEAIAHGVVDASHTSGTVALVSLPQEVLRFYLKHWNVDSAAAPFINISGFDQSRLDSLLDAERGKTVFYGQTALGDPENIARIQTHLPFISERHDMNEGQTFILHPSPRGPRVDDMIRRIVATPLAIEGEGWNVDRKIGLVADTLISAHTPPMRWDFTGHEYGAAFELPVYQLAEGPNDLLEVRADIERSDPKSDLLLVVELKESDSTRFYRASAIAPFNARNAGRHTLITAVKLADIPRHGADDRLRAYIYNPSRRMAWISTLRLDVRAGDPMLYGWLQPIAGVWKYR